MAFSIEQTKDLIKLVLKSNPTEAREVLHNELVVLEKSEPEFYASVIEHSPGLHFKPEEWFDLLSKIPTKVLREERKITDKLSEAQREKLPPSTLG